MEPKVTIECNDEECRHHDRIKNCKAENIKIEYFSTYKDDEETRHPLCKSKEFF